MNKQDGRASVPDWLRKRIIRKHGQSVMNELDVMGRYHDEEIASLGWCKANRKFRQRMKSAKMPFWDARVPISNGIGLYRWTRVVARYIYF